MSDSDVKGEVIRLVVGILVVDALAIGAYFLGGFTSASGRTRLVFVAGWTLASLVVVLVGLNRIREARTESMRRRRP
ncbi:MAG TPA: hypothetical protein VF037_00365 [Gemmatimonadales bacterium]